MIPQTINDTLPLSSAPTPKICIIHTGGTISMQASQQGYVPQKGHLAKLLQKMPEIAQSTPPIPPYDLIELEDLLDSSEMEPEDWQLIAEKIADCSTYSGFVVLHGTDTMAYTASALSFLLEDLDRPVIFTGSQIPLIEPRNDAREHLITAMILAAHSQIPEVCLYFRGKLMRGNRTTKIDADGLAGFASPNCSPLMQIGVKLDIQTHLSKKMARRPLKEKLCIQINPLRKYTIACIRIYPGFHSQLLTRLLPIEGHKQPIGLILECFGAGNGPEHRLRPVLEQLIQANVVIINVTQCLKGTVNLGLYAAGSWMHHIGVTSGLDMTPEAAMTKLFYLFQRYNRSDAPIVRELMQQNLRGELTNL